jgi:foldase protein PrsA
VPNEEVKEQFERIKGQQFPKAGGFARFLETSGQTVQDLLFRVKLDMLSAKIQQKVVKGGSQVTARQIAKYYSDNMARFQSPEKRTVESVLRKTEAAVRRVQTEVRSGKIFTNIVKQDSSDPANGDLHEVVKGDAEKALDATIFAAPARVLTGPVKTPHGYYLVEVLKIRPASHQTLKEAQSVIKASLTAIQEQATLSRFSAEFKRKWTDETECRVGYIVPGCREYKAQIAATAAAGTPTPTSPSK